MDERIGNVAAGTLLSLFVKEISLIIYNQTVAAVQERM
jgi:hypothetical protein